MLNRRITALAVSAALGAVNLAAVSHATASPAPSSRQAPAVHTAAPYLGWSSWSLQATKNTALNPRGDYSWLTERNVLTQAKALATTLKPAGYRYLNIDAGWWRQWDWTPEYDAHGRYAVDTARFPHGMQYTIDRIHALGLKVGIYVPAGLEKGAYDNGDFPVAGSKKCSTHDVVYPDRRTTNGWDSSYKIDMSRPCAQAWLDSETAQFAHWGIDFLKIDGVGPGSNRAGTNYDNRDEVAGWNRGLAKTGRKVVIQLSWALSAPYVADWQALADSRRIEADVECYCSTLTNWSAVSKRFADAASWAPFAGRGKGWNNLDSLDVGNGTADGLTDDERRSAATLWAISAAPLYSGDDLTKLDELGRQLLTNREVIRIDQAGDPAQPVDAHSAQQVWWAWHRDGSYTVALFNLDSAAAPVNITWSSLGISHRVSVHDVWSNSSRGTSRISYSATLPAHGTQLLTVRPDRRWGP